MSRKAKVPATPDRVRAPHNETSLAPSVATEPPEVNPTLEAALACIRRGWSVLPLYPKSKLPYAELLPRDRTGAPTWKLLTLRPASESEIRHWFHRDPNLNIGVALGESSGGLVVVDVDRQPSGTLHLPPTVQA